MIRMIRRLIIVGVAAVAVAAAAFVALVMVSSPSHEAVTWLRLRYTPETMSLEEWRVRQRTAVQALRSPIVLNAALRRVGIADLVPVRDCSDPVGWLTEDLRIEASEDSEVIRLRLRGHEPDDIRRILDAVASSYCDDVVNNFRRECIVAFDELEGRRKATEADLSKARSDLVSSLGGIDATASLDGATRRQLLLSEIDGLRRQRAAVISDQLAMSADAEAAQRLGDPADPRRAARMEVLERQAAALASEIDDGVRRLGDVAKADESLGPSRWEIEVLELEMREIHSRSHDVVMKLASKAPLSVLEESSVTRLGWWERLATSELTSHPNDDWSKKR